MEKYFDAFVDGELQAGALLELQGHLLGCSSCTALVGLRRRIKGEIKRLGEVETPPMLRARVLRIASGPARRNRIAAFCALPLAAAAALVLVLAWPKPQEAASEPLAAVVDDVVQRHSRDLPMEAANRDPEAAANWFQGKVDFPVRPVRLGLENASFGGARLSNVRSHQAAHMTYAVDGHRVSLIIFNPEHVDITGGKAINLGSRQALVGRRNGFNVVILLDNDMAYALSSDLPSERLLQLARNL
jgi:anti-sigma factor RsiW